MSETISEANRAEIRDAVKVFLAACHRVAVTGMPKEHIGKETASLAAQAIVHEYSASNADGMMSEFGAEDYIEAVMAQAGIEVGWRGCDVHAMPWATTAVARFWEGVEMGLSPEFAAMIEKEAGLGRE